MRPLNLLRLLARMARLHLFGQPSNHTADYDAAAETYDQYYSRHLGQGALELLVKLPVKPGMRLLDAACGTGFFTHALAKKVGPAGQVQAVDLSPGMLDKNRRAALVAGLHNIAFTAADVIGHMQALPTASLDGVVCGWGICYMDHQAFRQAAERVVRPGGFVAVIENRARTLRAVSKLFEAVLVQHPHALVKNMQVDLPKDDRYLRHALCRGALRAVDSWNGEVAIPCEGGQAIVDYMVKSGASAGFLDAIDPPQRAPLLATLRDEADRLAEKGRPVPVLHEFCALLAERE
jgi:ubiquinone/menaquinone biosynthesis C-methylase UbiE